MSRYTIAEFVQKTAQRDRGEGLFELENERMLEINLNGLVWTKMGSMVAYRGNVKFTREGILEHGIGKMFKRALSGEGTPLTKVEGQGAVYLADEGKKISILSLNNESIVVNGNDLLAFEPSIKWDITVHTAEETDDIAHIIFTTYDEFELVIIAVKPGSEHFRSRAQALVLLR